MRPHEDDENLVATSRGGGEAGRAAFAQLVCRYQDFVYRLAVVRLGREDLAREVAQETFLIAWRRIDQWPTNGGFLPWLARIALNVTRNVGRKERRRPIVVEADPSQPDCLEQVVRDEDDRRLWREVRNLPERQAQAVTLHYLLGWSVEDVGRALGCASGSVKSHLSRARQALRERLSRIVT